MPLPGRGAGPQGREGIKNPARNGFMPAACAGCSAIAPHARPPGGSALRCGKCTFGESRSSTYPGKTANARLKTARNSPQSRTCSRE